jgi:hypothetical protein
VSQLQLLTPLKESSHLRITPKMKNDKLVADDVNKGFEDTGHATRVTNTSTTDDNQLNVKMTSKGVTKYTINLSNHEGDKNQLDKQRHSGEEIQIPRGSSRWARDVRIIHKIVQLEKELGWPLTMLDLLCRFDRREIDSVSDILYWLDVKGVA